MSNPRGNPAWKKGVSGNPAGRPIGSRCKLELAFLDDCLASWTEKGAESLEVMRLNDPTNYCKMMAAILPKHSERTIKHDVSSLSDAEILALVRDTRDKLGRVDGAGGDGEAPKSTSQLN